VSAGPEARRSPAQQPTDSEDDLVTVTVAGTEYLVRFGTADLIEGIALDEIRDIAQENNRDRYHPPPRRSTRMSDTTIPAWVSDLAEPARGQIIAWLTADEVCACGCLDDDHDADSFCVNNTADSGFGEPHHCYAYNPVQR
jgi:hypothetical protein